MMAGKIGCERKHNGTFWHVKRWNYGIQFLESLAKKLRLSLRTDLRPETTETNDFLNLKL